MSKPVVCMIIEGSYPYICGGVASWCQSLISNLSDIQFRIVAILPEQYKDKKIQYELPENVISFHKIWLNRFGDEYKKTNPIIKKNDTVILKKFWKTIDLMCEQLVFNNYRYFQNLFHYLYPVNKSLLNFNELFASRSFFLLLKKFYKLYYPKITFMDFFWLMQNILQPIYKIGTYSIPEADCYHIISTGYAGYYGVLCKLRRNRPLILTEHGIYVNERRDEIDASEQIKEELKPVWKGFFKHLCSLTYPFCDRVITLYKKNAITEIEENCLPERIEIIPNGINLNLFTNIELLKRDVINVGIVARVVPIKDILTFIRAAHFVSQELTNIHFFIIGPTDEDEEYYEKCLKLVNELKMKEVLEFTGKVSMKEYYARIDIMVLTSFREAQPLTIMEAMAVGIPCVSSDVGSCSELLEGVGFITPRESPRKTANALIKLIKSDKLRDYLGLKSKVKALIAYDWQAIVNEYRRIYLKQITLSA